MAPSALLRALMLCCLVGAPGAGLGAGPPLPPPRPAEFGAAADRPSQPVEAPLPPRRPDDLSTASVNLDPEPPDPACLAMLTELKVAFERLPPIRDGACGADAPLSVTRIGEVELTGPVTTLCPVAAALARWLNEVVAEEAREHFGQPVTRLAVGGSYECRGQNRRSNGKLSEHAFANAIDLMGFRLADGRTISVRPQASESPEGRFQASVQLKACAYFTTVLGPGSDEAHKDHLHLDLRGRGRAARFCQ
jgi:hypothetical protein